MASSVTVFGEELIQSAGILTVLTARLREAKSTVKKATAAFQPTEMVPHSDLEPEDRIYWLHAQNDKYSKVSAELTGKWMLFPNKEQVNATWEKILTGVRDGNLWSAKVSVQNPKNPNTHAIMIYTKDFNDVADVLRVLRYLEAAGIKKPSEMIRYKTDNQTRDGIYSGGPAKPWIYSSETLNPLAPSMFTIFHQGYREFKPGAPEHSTVAAP